MTSSPHDEPAPRRIPRHQVVRRLLATYDDPRYLEVGVSAGRTFHQLAASTMVAVDPEFRFDHVAAAREHPHATYHPVTSDEYFGTVIGRDDKFEVVYLDGLHTFEQTLRDLLNALEHLTPDGVVVIDDVRPPSYHASLPDLSQVARLREAAGDPTKAWMGDVYRLVWFIDTFCQQLTWRTVANNHGQAVVWRQPRPSVTERSAREVAELPFERVVLDQQVLRLARFRDIVADFRAWRGLPPES
ncbi:class I SAM-dependent methyltransferase [Nocardioides sp. SYSU D00038]|uniref:class I SAM-dependent methyltransferase n=1 Tax=Nocardioides sp. SYSU D00038 TaxID=2812554 RepID=UPI001967D5AB|nr:class I SAM-dependent methyltransferase [Nocardioides sp. SYSU D00038]